MWRVSADGQWSPPEPTVASTESLTPTSALANIAGGVYDFTMGGIAGAVGAFVVFPIDLVSTESWVNGDQMLISLGQDPNSKSKVNRRWRSPI